MPPSRSASHVVQCEHAFFAVRTDHRRLKCGRLRQHVLCEKLRSCNFRVGKCMVHLPSLSSRQHGASHMLTAKHNAGQIQVWHGPGKDCLRVTVHDGKHELHCAFPCPCPERSSCFFVLAYGRSES